MEENQTFTLEYSEIQVGIKIAQRNPNLHLLTFNTFSSKLNNFISPAADHQICEVNYIHC